MPGNRKKSVARSQAGTRAETGGRSQDLTDKNQKIEEIKRFITNSEKLFDDVKINIEKHWKDFKEILDKKNLSRKECLLLPFKTILKALKI